MRSGKQEFPVQKDWTVQLDCKVLSASVHPARGGDRVFATNSSAVSLRDQWYDDLRFPSLSRAGVMIQEKPQGDTTHISCPR